MSIKCPKCKTNNPDSLKFCGECGTQLPSLQEIEVTETIEAPKEELSRGTTLADRYEIIEELGKGGMGRVYRVEDTKLKQEIALKLIKPEIAKDKKTIERFRNELKLAREIAHRNVCRMYDLNEEKGIHYITMEYVRGEDLRSLIRRIGQLPIGKSISITKQICEGLSEAHRLGVVHRDLKSNNIMIDKDGNVRIMDFGIARSLEAKGITGAGVMIGTPEYMSPEQVEGKEVDQRSDIYSLGVILYEMLTGRVPFAGDTPFTIGVKQKSEIPQNPKELNAQISDDLNRLILRCLEKEKEKRYQSAGEVRSELENIEKGIPTTERIIPDKKPLTSREITVQFSVKKMFFPALVIIAVVIIGIILWQVLPKQKTAPLAPSGKPSLAVMYFENNTGDEELDHWRKAIAELLITDLSQSKYITVLGRDSLYNILTQTNLLGTKSYSSEDIKEVATRGGVNHVLQGGFVKAGGTFRISYTLQEASSGKLLGSESMEGKGEESILFMVDDMTKKIKENFKLSQEVIASDIDRDIGTITTSSPEAYKFYMEGRAYHNNGDYKSAVQLYEKAISLDPEFATAYRSLAMACSNLSLSAEVRKYLQKSFELSDRVSDRERYRNEAEYYSLSEKTLDKAIEAYKKLLELYPDDRGGHNQLGLVFNNLEEWDKALERFEYLRQNKLATQLNYANLAGTYQYKGMHKEAIAVLEEYLSNFPDNFRVHYDLSDIYLDMGNYELALAELEKAFSLNPTYYINFRNKGDVYLCMMDLVNAEKEYQKLLNKEDSLSKAWGLARMGFLRQLQGRFQESEKLWGQFLTMAKNSGQRPWEMFILDSIGQLSLASDNYENALDEFDRALDIAIELDHWGSQRSAIYNKGLAYLELNAIDDALKASVELEDLCQKSMNKKLMRMHHNLNGVIELKKGNYASAIESIKKAISLDPNVFKDYIDSLALAYSKSGDLDNAIAVYEKIISCPRGMMRYGFEYVNSLYMLGKICEQQGDTSKAIEHYEKFLGIMKEADPGLPEVDDARSRLAKLKSEESEQ
jgi:tetratricopeptide (TPR) repeat protein/tRNA A-37 threonylcarbamoyl transferase component Bud32